MTNIIMDLSMHIFYHQWLSRTEITEKSKPTIINYYHQTKREDLLRCWTHCRQYCWMCASVAL